MIADSELKLNRPVAARAALKIAVHLQPGNEALREDFDNLFGEKSMLPESARKDYSFQSPAATLPAARRTAWDLALGGAATGKLTDAVRAFEQLTKDDEQNAAAWFNLGLARAWLGDNKGGLEALDRNVALETDETRAAAGWALGEVLRLGSGMEDQADYVEYAVTYQMRTPQLVAQTLQTWQQTRRLIILDAREEQGIVTGLVLDAGSPLAVGLGQEHFPRLGAYLLLVADRLQLWNVNRDAMERIQKELQQQAGAGLTPPHSERRPANFTGPFGSDVLAGAMSFPVGMTDKELAQRGVQEQEQRYFEDVWVHQPLRSLTMVPPVDAAGHGTLRKKLLGVVQFLEECGTVAGRAYDFNRLRRKLGLLDTTSAPAAAAAGPDVSAMGAAELAALPTESLSEDQLETAYRAALKLDAKDLAGRFAQVLVARPAQADKPDRYPFYSHLVQLALSAGDTDNALNWLNEGEKADCEQNEGRRRNDYELRRGQIHAKRGEADAAQDIFDRLIERVPSELRYRGSAAEAMLAARQGAKALRFAEQGVGKAREKQDRDSEQYFLELAAAARKQSS
jgi:hypothetical protein